MALEKTELNQIVIAGGVGANQRLRGQLTAGAQAQGWRVFYPPLELCTDNGAMIALAAALRLTGAAAAQPAAGHSGFSVRPRWDLASLEPVSA
jgi:N6-L-threonylcarbamoyladenine synthase